jgi:hypothetical protein
MTRQAERQSDGKFDPALLNLGLCLEVRMNGSESCLESSRQTTFWIGVHTRMLAAIGSLYCRSFHRDISRPVNGKYRCWRCLREFETGW